MEAHSALRVYQLQDLKLSSLDFQQATGLREGLAGAEVCVGRLNKL